MTDDELSDLACGWIACMHAQRGSDQHSEAFWAFDKSIDMLFNGQYEDIWKLILAIHALDNSIRIQETLSAGLIEDLLDACGQEFISRIEEEAKRDPSFAKVLGGVWTNSMLEEVAARLRAVWNRRGWDGIPE